MSESDELYYRNLRLRAYRNAEQAASKRGINVTLTEIDSKAVQASYHGGFTWAWDDDDNAHLASRFEVAVWERSTLTGLCRGKPIERNSKLCLDIIEASPNLHPGKRNPLLPIINACVMIYARQIGAKEVHLMEPTSKSRVRLYERLGFKYVPAGNYLVMKV